MAVNAIEMLPTDSADDDPHDESNASGDHTDRSECESNTPKRRVSATDPWSADG